MTNTQQRAALYLRISSDPGETALGVARQRKDGLALAASHDLDVPAHLIFTDNDESGGNEERPRFNAMKRAIENDGVRVIICYKIARLSRNATDSAWIDKMGERYGITIMETGGATYRLDDSSQSLSFGMHSLVAANLRKVTSELVRRKNRATREAGMVAGGRRSFGYTKAMKIIDHEAEALRWAYQAILDGKSLHAIARHWNDQGITTATGIPWTASKVSRLLRNKRNVAVLVHKDEEIGPGAWEAIVDHGTFYAVQLILNDPKRLGKGGPVRLLSGIARCGVDGCDSSVNIRKSTTKSGVYYGCKASPHLSRMAEPVETLVVGAILDRLSAPDAVDLLKPAKDDTEAATLFARKRQLESDLDDLAALLRQKVLTKAGVIKESAVIQGEIAEIDQALKGLSPDSVNDHVEALITADDIQAQWDSYEAATQRKVIHALVSVVILPTGPRASRHFDPSRIEITWRGL